MWTENLKYIFPQKLNRYIFQIAKCFDDGSDADLWRDGILTFQRQVRYLCVSRELPDSNIRVGFILIFESLDHFQLLNFKIFLIRKYVYLAIRNFRIFMIQAPISVITDMTIVKESDPIPHGFIALDYTADSRKHFFLFLFLGRKRLPCKIPQLAMIKWLPFVNSTS